MRGVGPWVLFAAAGAVGCGHLELHEMRLRAPGAYPSPSANAPAPLYVEQERPSRPFYDVALLQVVGYGADADADPIARALSSRATALGCDAVVGVRVDRGWTRAHGFGVCVRWSPVVPQGTPAPPAAPPNPQTSPTRGESIWQHTSPAARQQGLEPASFFGKASAISCPGPCTDRSSRVDARASPVDGTRLSCRWPKRAPGRRAQGGLRFGPQLRYWQVVTTAGAALSVAASGAPDSMPPSAANGRQCGLSAGQSLSVTHLKLRG